MKPRFQSGSLLELAPVFASVLKVNTKAFSRPSKACKEEILYILGRGKVVSGRGGLRATACK